MDIVKGILIGVIAGAFGGLFGIGGGLVMVPAMVYFLKFSQKQSQGTSLAVLMIPVGILGAINYYKSGNVDIRIALTIALGFIGGSYFGSKFALGLPEATVRKAFAVFLVLVAAQMFFKKDPPTNSLAESSTQSASTIPVPTNPI